MSDFKDGGPAFPRAGSNWKAEDGTLMGNNARPGMSLRDYFAAKAMQGELSAQSDENGGAYTDLNALAVLSYRIADAMLKAREWK